MRKSHLQVRVREQSHLDRVRAARRHDRAAARVVMSPETQKIVLMAANQNPKKTLKIQIAPNPPKRQFARPDASLLLAHGLVLDRLSRVQDSAAVQLPPRAAVGPVPRLHQPAHRVSRHRVDHVRLRRDLLQDLN